MHVHEYSVDKNALQSKADHRRMCVFSSALLPFLLLHLDLDRRTFVCEYDLGILRLFAHTKNEVSMGQGFQKLEHEQDRQTDRQTLTDATERYHAVFAASRLNIYRMKHLL